MAPFPDGPPFDGVERASVSLTSKLVDREAFIGRLHIVAEPVADEAGQLELQLGLISRRYIRDNELGDTLEECHRDIVTGFTAVTTDDMHKIWGRFR